MKKLFIIFFLIGILLIGLINRPVDAKVLRDDYCVSGCGSSKPSAVSKGTSGTGGRELTTRTTTTTSAGGTATIPSQTTIDGCRTGGCDLSTIIAQSTTVIYNQRSCEYYNPVVMNDPGVTGSRITTYMDGYAGFYKAPNGRYYPVGAADPPTPARAGGRIDRGEAGGPTPTAGPSPTPTPVVVPGPWTKLKNTSFYSNEQLWSQIPASPVAYDADDTTQPYFIVGEGGLVGAYPDINIFGLNSNAKTSANDFSGLYEPLPPYMSPLDFAQYVKGKKTYKEINNLDEINGDGIYFYGFTGNEEEAVVTLPNLNLTEVPADFNQYNIVLIYDGTININVTGAFNPVKSVALIAPTINIASTVTEIKSIIITKTCSLGDTVNQGLKIIGNLSVSNVFTNNRKWADLNKPSLFIINKPEMYLDLLPYITVANYDWQQLQ